MIIGDYVILEDVAKRKFVIASLKTFCIVQLEVSDQVTAVELATRYMYGLERRMK